LETVRYVRIGSLRSVEAFQDYTRRLNLNVPCDLELAGGHESPLAQPLQLGGVSLGNRIAIHPMEGWDGSFEGRPTEHTFRRWRRFGTSGAKLIWGGEAVAVSHDGRANPNQLLISPSHEDGLARLRDCLTSEHRRVTGSCDGLLIGLQLTHSGRYSRPGPNGRPEPRILYHHPILDHRLKLPADYSVLTDGEIRQIVENFQKAARIAQRAGFEFVDIKHCHGYLGHEFLSAHSRGGDYGGSFENRTRFLREIVEGVRASAPGLKIGVRLSVFDTVPYSAGPDPAPAGKHGLGTPEPFRQLLPYRFGFGVNPDNPLEPDLTEPLQFLGLLSSLGIPLVNLSAGSPYYNPHIQRPAFFPPSDGYAPPEDPLVGAVRQLGVVRTLKAQFPELIFVGSAYSYFQDFLPYVAQAAVREAWVDCVGLGRMTLVYPEVLREVLEGKPVRRKQVCRTFSDCTTAPRLGLRSGCYPLDDYYAKSSDGVKLKKLKREIGSPS
jgi:NADPH2 dehydrogenase